MDAGRWLEARVDARDSMIGGINTPPASGRTEAACELLGRWGSFGWWLQIFLGLVCLVSLVGKRFTDSVRRPWKVWFFDTSKQGVQALMNHLINIGLSMAFGQWLDADSDPCNWYWINLTLDCTLGVAIIYFLLRTLQCTYRLKCVGRPELARCGDYGEPPDVRIFARQMLDWQVLVIVQKLMLALLVINFRGALAVVAVVLLGWLDSRPKAKLVVVMVITPLALNIFAFWTADSFLQAHTLGPRAEEVQARESLVQGAPIVGQSTPALLCEETGEEGEDRIISFQEWEHRKLSTAAHTPAAEMARQ